VAVLAAVGACGTFLAAPAQADGGSLVTWKAVSAHHCTSRSNVKESGGYLHLITTANGCGIRLESTKSYRYGDFAARIKFDLAPGFHGGFTFYGTPVANWPRDGEIDIAEELGRKPGGTYVRVWTQKATSHAPKQCGKGANPSVHVNGEWHVYGFSWHPGKLAFTLDGRTVWSWTAADAKHRGCTWPFDAPGYSGHLYLNTSAGDKWAGPVPKDHHGYPLDTLVDYVKAG
jgi:beta-glucanase (GH16 family)